MASVNMAILVGNLGKDPEIRSTSSGKTVANFNIATNEKWTDKASGQAKERTEWHKVIAWGKLGEFCGEYLKKGKSVYVQGSIQTRSWDDKTGNKRYTTEIVAQRIQLLGAPGVQNRGGDEAPPPPDFPEAGGPPGGEDDVPF